MVLIVGFKQRENSEGENFNVLLLESGEIELVESQQTGNIYATARRCSITCTFNDQRCEALIGKSLTGKIERTACDEYDFQIPGTKETVKLKHTWKFNPEPSTVEEHIFDEEVKQEVA